MHIAADFWSAMDVGGADLVYAWGVRQGGANAEFTQTATLGVEANMTDWATLRAGMNWWYQLSGDDEVVGDQPLGLGGRGRGRRRGRGRGMERVNCKW